MEAAGSSKTSVTTHQITRYHNTEDHVLNVNMHVPNIGFRGLAAQYVEAVPFWHMLRLQSSE